MLKILHVLADQPINTVGLYKDHYFQWEQWWLWEQWWHMGAVVAHW
jgi:hypothetical protein